MGQTKFQKMTFTLLMCFFMVLGMTIYNMILNEGLSDHFLIHLLKDFWLGFIVALIIDVFKVVELNPTATIAPYIDINNTIPTTIQLEIAKIILIGFVSGVGLTNFKAIGLASFPTIKTSIINSTTLKIYPLCVARNFIMALPLNLLIVSPLVRFLFTKIPFEKIEKNVSNEDLSFNSDLVIETE